MFIDEIDKIVTSRNSPWRSGDPSSEGVQRDLLPIIEGGWVYALCNYGRTSVGLRCVGAALHRVCVA